jgi:Raf kinase inhibitor-like YbhB/YbcL family protein
MPSVSRLAVTSTAFAEGETIPRVHTCDGKDTSPALHWGDAPAGTRAWAVLCEDPDAPMKTWVHWVLWNLPAEMRDLREAVPTRGMLDTGAVQGKNDFARLGYGGPCPPRGKPHRYVFRVVALDAPLPVLAGATRNDVERAMKGHVLAEGTLTGIYART